MRSIQIYADGPTLDEMKILDLESIKFSNKSGRIDILLRTISTLSEQYVEDKSLKNEVTNKAAQLLKKELEDF